MSGTTPLARLLKPCATQLYSHSSTVPEGNKVISQEQQRELIEAGGAQKGYIKDLTSGDAGTDVGREGVSRLTVRFLRFVIHSLLAFACAAMPGGAQRVAVAVMSSAGAAGGAGEQKADDAADDAADWAAQRLKEDWSSLRDALNLNDKELAVALHMAVMSMRRLGKGREVLTKPFQVAVRALRPARWAARVDSWPMGGTGTVL